MEKDNNSENRQNRLSKNRLSKNPPEKPVRPRRRPQAENDAALLYRTTPVPNALLDQVLPTLRDTELRVLLIVCRQTHGWRVWTETGKAGAAHYARKRRDWITHAQLMRKTGRASAAVSRAVEMLARRGLLVVEDAAGQSLPTAAERRRFLGRLYYRLGTMDR